MALKDDWKDLENKVQGDPDSGSEISVEPINKIAHAVIDLEKNGGGGSSIIIDTEMSSESENAVQNKVIKKYVDDITGNLSLVLEEIHNYAQSIINGGVSV
jgi:hypothetical protein